MTTRTMAPRAALAALTLTAVAAPSCAKQMPPGEVMMVVETDMSLPKDVDTVVIEVLVRGDQRFKQTYEKLGSEESLRIPASLGIVVNTGNDPTTPVTLRVTASQKGQARVLREAVTTVPEDRVATLRLPVEWLCWNQVLPPDAEGNTQTSCPDGQTCVAGSCASKTIDVSTLPTYSPGAVFGGGTGTGDGSCLDVATCFTGSVDAPVDLTDCTIAPSGSVNVAIRVDTAGICGPAGCFVTLDGNSDSGWQPGSGGKLKLPPAVCARITAGTAGGVSVAGTSSACPLKTSSLPACGPWSSAGKAPAAPGTVTPVALVANQDHPVSLAVAGGNVYWTNSGPSDSAKGTVKRMPIGGGSTTLISATQAFPKSLALALDTSNNVTAVYWATNGVTPTPGSVLGADLTGTAPKPITFTIPGLVSPEGLSLQGGNLFFTDFGGNAVYSLSLATGMATTISGPATSSPQSGANRVAADSKTVFWTNETMPGAVMMADQADPAPIAIATNQGTPRELALDLTGGAATAVYWANFSTGEVMMAPITATSPATAGTPVKFADTQVKPYGVTVDATDVYWTNDGDGTVSRAAKAGGAPVVIAHGQTSPGAIVVDATNVYWINQGTATKSDGAIMKLAKPAP